MPEPLWTPAPPPSRPELDDSARAVDAAITVVLLVTLLPLAFIAAFVGLLTGLGVEGCAEETVCTTVLEAGSVTAGLSPLVLWVLAAVASTVRLVRRRRAWWLPLVAVALWLAIMTIVIGLAALLQP